MMSGECMKKQKIKINVRAVKNSGLTLVETLIAISILIVAVVMSISLYVDNIANARFAHDQIIATYLAEEGIELVRQVVYTNFNNGGVNWVNDLANCWPNGCRVGNDHWNSIGFASCGGGNCPKLKIHTAAGFLRGVYGHPSDSTGWEDTPFTRKIEVSSPPGDVERTVTSTVTWNYHGATKNVTLKTYIYNYLN